ncbi:GDSL lipase-like [Punica granatum]|uniref:GDSL lipase-like n=1 Tax=Punica granatum TaxID=22663 RepID=A0A6P8E3J1_PUNGR|nr:GDSL lipase-like [Punica granatum]
MSRESSYPSYLVRIRQTKHILLLLLGDSLFSPGNNNYIKTNAESQTNVWPHRETYFEYPTGRFSHDHLIPDFIGNTGPICGVSKLVDAAAAFLLPGNYEFTVMLEFSSSTGYTFERTATKLQEGVIGVKARFSTENHIPVKASHRFQESVVGGSPYRGIFSCGGKRTVKEYVFVQEPEALQPQNIV